MLSEISVVIITKDEEVNIEDCLKSVSSFDDVIIVDAESKDKTLETAKKYTPKVFIRKWTTYSEQKNYGIDKAKNNWILNIDADERVSEELLNELLGLQEKLKESAGTESHGRVREGNNIRGYKIPIRNYYFNRFLRHGGFFPDYHLRLFDKRYGKFESKIINVHEGVYVNGDTGYLNSPIIHYAYKNIKNYFYKFNKYTTMEASGFFNNRIMPTGYNLFIKPLHRFVKSYIIKAGFLDGIAGFLACMFASMYIFIAEIKLIEYYGFDDKNINLLKTLFTRKRR